MTFLSTILAQNGTSINIGQANVSGATGLNTFDIPGLIQFAITAIIIVAGLIFFFMLIIGGLRWILSGGDKAQTESARSQITAALIGLVIVFSAWAITSLIKAIFGIDILNLNIPGVTTGGTTPAGTT